jgi:hypothetical protein
VPDCPWNVRLEKPSLTYNCVFVPILHPGKYKKHHIVQQYPLASADAQDAQMLVPIQLNNLLHLRNWMQLCKLFCPNPELTQQFKFLYFPTQYMLHKLNMLILPVLFLLYKLDYLSTVSLLKKLSYSAKYPLRALVLKLSPIKQLLFITYQTWYLMKMDEAETRDRHEKKRRERQLDLTTFMKMLE